MPKTNYLVSVAAIIGSICLSTWPVLAAQLPFKWHAEQNIDTHQIGYLDVSIDQGQTVVMTANFSNGQKISGNNFYSLAKFVSADGKVIKSVLQEKGLDGSLFSRAREGSVTNSFNLTAQELATLDHIETKFGVMNCGMELTDLHFDEDGINVTFGTKKCNDNN